MRLRSPCTLALVLLTSACSDDGPAAGDLDATQEDAPVDAPKSREARVPDAGSAAPHDASTRPHPSPPTTPVEHADRARCDTALEITVRDFTEAHPDFERFLGALTGIVAPQLGPDKKPVYASAGPTAASTGPAEFAQWYNDVPGVNQRLSHRLEFTERSQGVYVYDNASFFPIDGLGFGNGPAFSWLGPAAHNSLFTTEAHTTFPYRGGETFSFSGDDDLWVFLNDRLAIDLGGTHSRVSASIDLDAEAERLGLVKGRSYAMDIFHAERHTDASNFHVDTNLAFVDCGSIPPDPK